MSFILLALKVSSCTVFIRFAHSFFELTYMVLQNKCIINVATNGLKQEIKKHAKQLYVANKREEREARGEWLI